MDERSGLFEELMYKNKSYPSNSRAYPLQPQTYADAIIQQISREIGDRLQVLAGQGDYQGMFELANELRRKIDSPQIEELQMPLQAIHYSFDDRLIPVFPEMFLTSPLLITNYGLGDQNLFKMLKFELITADSADFMVSFIRWSGLQLLLRAFDEMQQENKKVRILTSTYLKYTEPKALRRLHELDNVELRVFNSGQRSFHTKAYLFTRESGMDTTIIGSSNLSKAALQDGFEWNVKLPTSSHIPVAKRAHQIFEEMWSDPRSIPVTDEFLERYEFDYQQKPQMKFYSIAKGQDVLAKKEIIKKTPTPNPMQVEALQALRETRQNGYKRGVIIAATGTGKTYLSAFDVHQFEASTLLFLAHRDELLEGAKTTFAHVFNDPEMCGKLSGTQKDWDRPYLFSTVQTMYREDVLARYQPDHFEYIIVDEFHHAQADTYQKILDYFKPKFLLGLTATPERMDGRDVLALCDHNVVYETRLRDALKRGMLVPFHYFGLSDPHVDYEEIPMQNGTFNEAALVHALNSHERVGYVIDMIQKFGHDGDLLKALGFCASIEHAQYMSNEFNSRGYHTACLTGNDHPVLRQEMISRLINDKDPLHVIFTVNIFNEGVDIPTVNMLLFLRPTDSATIFIQQLGRGLRKAKGKEYVTVLDFIGNYQKSFIVPLALSGQVNHKAFDRDALRVTLETEFSNLPEGCYVDLEEISRQQILNTLDNVRMDSRQMLTDLYNQFRRDLGYSPELPDFLYSEQAPSLFYFIKKFGSWVQTKKAMKDLNEFDINLLASEFHFSLVQRLEQMLPLRWPYEFVVLDLATKLKTVTVSQVISELQKRFSTTLINEQVHGSFVLQAMRRLSKIPSKQQWAFGEFSDEQFIISEKVFDAWHVHEMAGYLQQRLIYGLIEFHRTSKPDIFFGSQNGLIEYQNYTRNELMFLFQSPAQEGSWREGVSKVDNHYLIFINLNKDEGIADHLDYKDYFVDNQHFHWQSPNQDSHQASRGQLYVEHKNRDVHFHLFVRKFKEMHGTTLPFTYVGEMDYMRSSGDRPMNITWKLHRSIPDDLFNDLIR
ncbi:DUF3427 domain-containing protein [Tumebacillus permanentifrigoris]|uniref:Superfamily II DNA or RNA helicase n=1 Tax=Tumebacillus permanentifrigoris TaxID=378543 RepID=A0A316DEI7_9BACL|nr:DUF3427 domain-containing protein [Tumebacillus permanentifrigoris]PWK15972.1 superfamily II DNA or RNA helicase [Tumebacillus permanentifrigoris]